MLEKTWEVPQLVVATYAHTLVIESTHAYNKVHGRYGSNNAWILVGLRKMNVRKKSIHPETLWLSC